MNGAPTLGPAVSCLHAHTALSPVATRTYIFSLEEHNPEHVHGCLTAYVGGEPVARPGFTQASQFSTALVITEALQLSDLNRLVYLDQDALTQVVWCHFNGFTSLQYFNTHTEGTDRSCVI